MRRVKTLCHYLPLLTLTAAVAWFSSSAHAAIVFSGDYSPASDSWNSEANGYVGNLNGDGTTTVTDGSDLTCADAFIGNLSTMGNPTNGTVTVDGIGSTFTATATLYSTPWYSYYEGGNLAVGQYGYGTLNISNGGAVNALLGAIGCDGQYGGGVGVVNVSGSATWTNSGDLFVGLGATEGYGGAGTLNIQTGGTVSSLKTTLSNGAAGGTITVDGNGSTLCASYNEEYSHRDALLIGQFSDGLLNVQNGGYVHVVGNTIVGGYTAGGTICFSGGTLNTTELQTAAANLTGTGVIQTCGLVGDIDLTFDGSAIVTTAFGSAGTLSVNMSATSGNGDLGVGLAGQDSLTIRNGATVYSNAGILGVNTGSTGTAEVNAATWNLGDALHVGSNGMGVLRIENGGHVNNLKDIYTGAGVIGGDDSNMSGTVAVDGPGSSWNMNGSLFVGYMTGSSGTLMITNGASVSNIDGYVGSYLNIPFVAVQSSGTVAVDAATWTNTGALRIGCDGEGMLTISNGGMVVANAVAMATNSNATGTLIFHDGTLKANAANTAWITADAGTCNVSVEQGGAMFDTNGYDMGIAVTLQHGGAVTDGGITKLGAGTLLLTGANNYSGPTTVVDGVLELGSSAQSVVLTGGGADIQGGRMVFDYSGTAPDVGTLLANSFHAGAWDQGQFHSTTQDGNHGLGWLDDGVDEVTVMYTLYGDSNLDGSVNGTDLNAVLSYYNQSDEVWANGDFNYDGSVNGTDLNTVLSNYNQSLSSSTAAVPEPSTLLLMAFGLLGLLAWRKRN